MCFGRYCAYIFKWQKSWHRIQNSTVKSPVRAKHASAVHTELDIFSWHLQQSNHSVLRLAASLPTAQSLSKGPVEWIPWSNPQSHLAIASIPLGCYDQIKKGDPHLASRPNESPQFPPLPTVGADRHPWPFRNLPPPQPEHVMTP